MSDFIRPTQEPPELSAQESSTAGPNAGPPPPLRRTHPVITWRDRLDHYLARWGYKRGQHRVAPGLYAVGQPRETSPVLVTANYTLSFDAVRSVLTDIDAYILVLDTRGINVWCAASKGTFSTDELVKWVFASGLHRIVKHRKLILPQLGATGVSAHKVKQRAGFRVAYGPVRASDLPSFLLTGKITPEMRRVTFDLSERLVLIPIEVVHTLLPMLGAAVVLGLLAGPSAALGVVLAVLAGTVLFPLLLPWLPLHDFSAHGYLLGILAALPAPWATLGAGTGNAWTTVARAVGLLIGLPAATSYLAMNFTGATPITSPSWVRREMRRYIPIMAATVILGALLIIAAAIGTWIGR